MNSLATARLLFLFRSGKKLACARFFPLSLVSKPLASARGLFRSFGKKARLRSLFPSLSSLNRRWAAAIRAG
jgi:hypothetical protein